MKALILTLVVLTVLFGGCAVAPEVFVPEATVIEVDTTSTASLLAEVEKASYLAYAEAGLDPEFFRPDDYDWGYADYMDANRFHD